MPLLKLTILNELVDSYQISFSGLEKEERVAHVQGLAAWIKSKNLVEQPYEIFIDRVPSKANLIINEENLHEKVFNRYKGPRTGYKHPVKLRRKEDEEDKPVKFERPKPDHTNKKYWED